MNIFINILIVIAVFLVLTVLGCYLLLMLTFVRNKSQNHDRKEDGIESITNPDYKVYYEEAIKGEDYIMSLNPEDVMTESFDGLKLYGYFIPADKPTNKTLLCIHGYRAYGIYEFGARTKYMHELGWNLLLPDDRAHGRSEGRYIGFGNLDSEDVLEWCDYLVKRFGNDSTIVLHGVSMGAAAVMAAAGSSKLPSQVKAVIEDCGFSSGYDEVVAQAKGMYHLPERPFVPICRFLLKLLAKYDLKEKAPKDLISNFKGKLLIIHGDSDTFVPTYMSQIIYDAFPGEKDLLLVKGAKHATAYVTDKRSYEEHFSKLINSID